MKNSTKKYRKPSAKKMIKLDEIEVMNLKQSHNFQGGEGSEGDLRSAPQ